MALTLNLTKSAQTLRLSLEKAGFRTPPVVDIAFNLDVSVSYEDEHLDGSTNALMARLVPWGLVFDPDKKLDVFTFSSHKDGAQYVGEVTDVNYEGYVARNIIKKVNGWNGGTHYSHVLRKNLQHFGWLPQDTSEAQPVRKSGFFSRFLSSPEQSTASSSTTSASAVKRKSLILHNTDGGNDDRIETTKLLETMEREGYEVYIMFIAYANSGADFSYLEKVSERFSNTGLHVIKKLSDFTEATDEQLNEWLITDELVAWLKK